MLSLLLMPEWYLILLGLGLLAILGRSYETPVDCAAGASCSRSAPLVQAWRSAGGATFHHPPRSAVSRFGLRMFTAVSVRHAADRAPDGTNAFTGSLRCEVSLLAFARLVRCRYQIWSETWRAPAEWLEGVERVLRAEGRSNAAGGRF